MVLSAEVSLIADDDYVHHIVESGNYMKMDTDPSGAMNTNPNEEKKEEEDDEAEEEVDQSKEVSDEASTNRKNKKEAKDDDHHAHSKDFKKLLNEIEVRFRKEDP